MRTPKNKVTETTTAPSNVMELPTQPAELPVVPQTKETAQFNLSKCVSAEYFKLNTKDKFLMAEQIRTQAVQSLEDQKATLERTLAEINGLLGTTPAAAPARSTKTETPGVIKPGSNLQKILAGIQANPGKSATEIQALVGLSFNPTSYLKKLLKMKVARKQGLQYFAA